jgi:hypothetical protein
MNYLEIDEVVAESVATLGDVENEEMAKIFARQWIWRGLQDLGVADEDIKVCKILAKNYLIPKPKEMRRFLDIAIYDVEGNELAYTFRSGRKAIHNTETWDGIDLSESDTAIVIGTNGADVSYAWFRYYSYPLSDKGLPMVREDEVEALTLLVRYKWSLRKNDNQSEIAQNRQMWAMEADRARAKKKSYMSVAQKNAIDRSWMNLLPGNERRF